MLTRGENGSVNQLLKKRHNTTSLLHLTSRSKFDITQKNKEYKKKGAERKCVGKEKTNPMANEGPTQKKRKTEPSRFEERDEVLESITTLCCPLPIEMDSERVR